MQAGVAGRRLEKLWCERGDSNPHGFPRQILSLVRLPIPPLSHHPHILGRSSNARHIENDAERSQKGITKK